MQENCQLPCKFHYSHRDMLASLSESCAGCDLASTRPSRPHRWNDAQALSMLLKFVQVLQEGLCVIIGWRETKRSHRTIGCQALAKRCPRARRPGKERRRRA